MKVAPKAEDVANLKAELHRVRQQSLLASRQNDFRAVARLTTEAARLNREIQSQEEFAGFSPRSMAVVDALASFDDAGHFSFPMEAPAFASPATLDEHKEAA